MNKKMFYTIVTLIVVAAILVIAMPTVQVRAMRSLVWTGLLNGDCSNTEAGCFSIQYDNSVDAFSNAFIAASSNLTDAAGASPATDHSQMCLVANSVDRSAQVCAASSSVTGTTSVNVSADSLSLNGTPVPMNFTALIFGSGEGNSVAASSSAFMGPGTSRAPAGADALVANPIPAPNGCVASNFHVTITSAQPGSGSITFTLRKDGSPTAVTFTIAAGSSAGTYADSTHSVTFPANSKMSIGVVNNATGASAGIGPWSVGCTE